MNKSKLIKYSMLFTATILVISVSWVFYGRLKSIKNNEICMNNFRLMSRAISLYTEDYDGFYPSPDAWFHKQLKIENISCPSAKSIGKENYRGFNNKLGYEGYAINSLIMGNHISRVIYPATTVVICEQFIGLPIANAVDMYESLPSRPRGLGENGKQHYGESYFLFADGHVSRLKKDAVLSELDHDGNTGVKASFSVGKPP